MNWPSRGARVPADKRLRGGVVRLAAPSRGVERSGDETQ